jgi:cell division transport system permease protein
VGASRAYIRFPLLVGGAFQGIVGAGFALGLLFGAHHAVKDILNVPPLWITISFLPKDYILAILGVPAVVGMFGSFVAFRN